MKILMLIDNLGAGGAQRQVVTLSKLFSDKGLNVTILLYNKDINFFEKDLCESSIAVKTCHHNNSIIKLLKIRSFIRNSGSDVVISFMDTPNFINCFSAIGGKSWKVITNERSAKDSTFTTKKGKIFLWFQRYADEIVCNSYNAMAMWKKNAPKYSCKLDVIYNAVSLSKINTAYHMRHNDKTNITVVASYRDIKNPHNLVKAISLLNATDKSSVVFDWYGNKIVSHEEQHVYSGINNLIKEKKLLNVINLHDASTNIHNIMNRADVIALFSKVEGLPNAICEAMIIGKPVIMTRVSDFSTLVNDNGVLCDWDNVDSIKNAIRNMVRLDNISLEKMGKVSKQKAKTLFEPDYVANQWITKFKKK